MSANSKSPSRLPLYIVLGLVIVVTVGFLLAFLITTETEIEAKTRPTPELSASSYMAEVNGLLAQADAANGAHLVEQYGCTACHREGAVNKIAPPFVGIAERSETRRPPLSSAAYIYESVTNPSLYVVEGFNPAMPQNFQERLSDKELGDIIAFLLTPDAH